MEPKTPLAQEFAKIFAVVRWAIFWRTPREVAMHAFCGVLITLAQTRMNRFLIRFDRLVALWKAGKLPKPRKSHPGKTGPRTLHPAGRRWLPDIIQATIVGGNYLEQLFEANPEVRQIVEATPSAGRLLRPLCNMLGAAQPDWLAIPKKPRAKPAPKPRAPKPERPTPHRSSDPERLRMKIPGVDFPLPKYLRDPKPA